MGVLRDWRFRNVGQVGVEVGFRDGLVGFCWCHWLNRSESVSKSVRARRRIIHDKGPLLLTLRPFPSHDTAHKHTRDDGDDDKTKTRQGQAAQQTNSRRARPCAGAPRRGCCGSSVPAGRGPVNMDRCAVTW